MFKVEALTLETAIYPTIIPGVAKLIQNSPRLKTIKFETVDCKMLEVIDTLVIRPFISLHFILCRSNIVVKALLSFCCCMQETRLTNYLYWKGLETRQCWEPKDVDGPSLSEPKLMTSVMKFLLKTSRNEWYKDGSYTFSLNKNSELSFVTHFTQDCLFP